MVSYVINIILKITKLRLRDHKGFAIGHTAELLLPNSRSHSISRHKSIHFFEQA